MSGRDDKDVDLTQFASKPGVGTTGLLLYPNTLYVSILFFSTWRDDRDAKKADAIRSLTSIAIVQISILVLFLMGTTALFLYPNTLYVSIFLFSTWRDDRDAKKADAIRWSITIHADSDFVFMEEAVACTVPPVLA